MESLIQLKELANKVNTYWQKKYQSPGNCAWEHSCYLLGNMAAYELTQNDDFLSYALKWADCNNWSFYIDVKDGMDYGNDLLCGNIYFQLSDITKRIYNQSVTDIMNECLKDKKCDYWWWIDAIYMALPFFCLMGNKSENPGFFDKAYLIYTNARNERRLFDKEEKLWYRDERYLPEQKLEANGKKIFWGRGNGWVFAGLARALEIMGKDNKYYEYYLKDFCDMAKSLKNVQNADGSYCVSFFDKDTYPYHESSSTVLITLGYLIGLKLGIFDYEYYQIAIKGFRWLTDVAMNDDGFIGYSQDIAGWPSHKVYKDLSKDYVVGTYLMILKELSLLNTNKFEERLK